MKRFLLTIVLLLSIVGCALFAPGEVGPDGKRESLGRDLGGAAQMVIEGEYIAGGVASLMAILAATGRYFFRRGERAEKRKVGEIAYAVERTLNGEPVKEVLATTPMKKVGKKKIVVKKKAKKQPA
jgi:hypothetical protein